MASREQRQYQRRRDKGLCMRHGCEEQRLPDHTCCVKHKESERLRATDKNRRMKLRVLDAYGGRQCVGCGETEIVVLSIDHINGGGTKHRASLTGGARRFYHWLIHNNFPPGFRVLCMNCQFRARFGVAFPKEHHG